MFSSLRFRLWLSYAFLITLALSVMMLAILGFLLRNPLIYRQTLSKLKTVETFVLTRAKEVDAGRSPDEIETLLFRADSIFDVRLLWFDKSETLRFDTRADLPPIRLPARASALQARDSNGKVWLISRAPFGEGILLAASPRPTVRLMNVLKDELMPPFWGAGALSLIVSLLLALGMARWVADPLQNILNAARAVPSANPVAVPPRGPREVQELARAFNEMAARVRDTQQSQREFVANVSHELKTPLTSIQGFSQALLDGAADTPEKQREAAEIIYAEAERMHRMALDLLELARLDAGIAEFRAERVELRALLENLKKKFAPQAREKNIRLESDLRRAPELPGDGDRLAQVFSNLLDNALKHTPSGGTITLRAESLDGEARVLVADTGEGIPEEALPHIFERFYQADSSRSGAQGTGLGLAIAREIVQAHGGRITVRSRQGKGSEFTVFLPLEKPL